MTVTARDPDAAIDDGCDVAVFWGDEEIGDLCRDVLLGRIEPEPTPREEPGA